MWVGGFVALVVVARVSRDQLEPAVRVRLFRAIGRCYGFVAGSSLAIALVCGVILLADHGWDSVATGALGLALVLVLSTAAGVRQARGMTRLRERAIEEPDAQQLLKQLARGARRAAILRATIGALSLALVALAAAVIAAR
ncbi:MAG: hypothetical protein ABI950_07135 [Solirubrobacteraceae bacterium]